MNSSVSTPDLVRDDVRVGVDVDPQPADAAGPARRGGRVWALSGLAAGLLMAGGTMYIETNGNPAYDMAIRTNPDAVLAKLGGLAGQLVVFHVALTLASLLLVVFAAGLQRRLRVSVPGDSLVPTVAAAGLLVTSVMLMMGTALDTEVIFGAPSRGIDAGTATLYSHWIGTVPWVWTGVGLSAVAVAVASLRGRALPRWIGVVGLGFGLLTLGTGLSPLQYLSGMTGVLWIVVTSSGLMIGDKTYRQGR